MSKSRFTEEQIIGMLKEHQAGTVGRRSLPQARDQRCHVLQVAVEVWRHGGLRRAQAEGAGGREPQAEEAAGGDDAGCGDAEGDAGKKLLTPSARRRAVSWAIEEKSYSQRRACGLVGLEPKTYRYASTRPDDGAVAAAAEGTGFGAPAVRLPAPAPVLAPGGHRAELEEALPALSEERLTVRKRGGRKRALGTTGADDDPAGPQPALVARLRLGHAGRAAGASGC